MDAGIADTINRLVARRIASQLDLTDWFAGAVGAGRDAWHYGPMSQTLMGENDADDSDRAWLVGVLAEKTHDVEVDAVPADFDWENLFSHLRAEIQARRDRDPQTPSVPEQTVCGMV
jgi:hypothetical protein